ANNVLFVYQYDFDHRLTNRWSAAKAATRYLYDHVGNLTNVAYPVNPTISLAYDAMNQLTNMVDGIGTNMYTYTAAGQLQSEDGPWANDTVTNAYVNRMRTGLDLAQPSGGDWVASYGYDAIGRLTNLTSQAGSFGYQYPAGRQQVISRISFPSGAFITNT